VIDRLYEELGQCAVPTQSLEDTRAVAQELSDRVVAALEYLDKGEVSADRIRLILGGQK